MHTALGQAQPAHIELSLQNIFHGGMSLDQLYFARPAPSYSGYRSPIPGLYLCGSGAHPGEQCWEPGPYWGAAEGGWGCVEEMEGHHGGECVHCSLCPLRGREMGQLCWCSPAPHLLALELLTTANFCSLQEEE